MSQTLSASTLLAVPLAPLAGSLLAGLFGTAFGGNWFGRRISHTLTPLMERIEAAHPGIKVFSLPSVDHPQYGRHIELGVKGPAADVPAAWTDLLAGLHDVGANCGPELVRKLR